MFAKWLNGTAEVVEDINRHNAEEVRSYTHGCVFADL